MKKTMFIHSVGTPVDASYIDMLNEPLCIASRGEPGIYLMHSLGANCRDLQEAMREMGEQVNC